MKKVVIFITLIVTIFSQFSCKKFVQVDAPTTSLASTSVYKSNSSAAAVLTGIYADMATDGTFAGGNGSIGYLCGNAADELQNYSSAGPSVIFYSNSYSPTNLTVFWSNLYQEIYVANAVIQGISNSNSLSQSIKNQLLGEAYFIRAFLNFYATNLYGNVPLVTTTNYLYNNTIHSSPSSNVYQQIVVDLKNARSLLSPYFVDPTGTKTTERIRPNQGAAAALLARVYLYQQKWDSAANEASSVIANGSLYNLDTLNGVFLKNSPEGIWELQSITPGYNTLDGEYYILTSSPGADPFSVALSSQLLSAFEPGDNRLSKWIGTYTNSGQSYSYPFKYKQGQYDPTVSVSEYEVVLRLAEQYLIRAESEAQQGNLFDATTDLNLIRHRSGLGNTTAVTQADVLTAIYHERQVELFTEWGHRWFDLKRVDSLNSVMSLLTPQKGGTWSSFKSLLPIPFSETQLNPNLTQNPGYTN